MARGVKVTEWTVSERDLYWLAGLLEGEGSFLTDKSARGKPAVSLCMTDEDVIQRAAAVMGVGYGRKVPTKSGFPSRKPAWVIRVTGSRAVLVMRRIYPIMGERRQAAIVRAIYSYDDRSWRLNATRVWDRAERDRALSMLRQGATYPEVHAALGGTVSKATIANYARAAGIPSGYRSRGQRAAAAVSACSSSC